MTVAYHAGRAARYLGRSFFANPYPALRCVAYDWEREHEAQRAAWGRGWMEMDAELWALHKAAMAAANVDAGNQRRARG